MSFEIPKSAEEIRKLTAERKSSDDKLEAEGATRKDGRLEITEEQFEAAKKEMEDDLRSGKNGKPKSREDRQKEVQKQISALEENLGIPISDKSKEMIHENQLEGAKSEESNSQKDANRDNRLKQEAEDLGQKQREKEASASSLKEAMKDRNFIDSVRKLAYILKEREANRFNPLINPNAIPYLISAASDLESAITNKKSSLEDMSRSVRKIGGAIKAIGEVPKQRTVNDNSESLAKVGWALQNIGQASMELRSRAGSLEDTNMKEMLHYLRSLENLVKDKWVGVVRKKSDLEAR